MTIVSLEEKRKEEAIAKIKTAHLLIDSAIDVLCGVTSPNVHCARAGARSINYLRLATGNLVPGTGMLGDWIEQLGGEA